MSTEDRTQVRQEFDQLTHLKNYIFQVRNLHFFDKYTEAANIQKTFFNLRATSGSNIESKKQTKCKFICSKKYLMLISVDPEIEEKVEPLPTNRLQKLLKVN